MDDFWNRLIEETHREIELHRAAPGGLAAWFGGKDGVGGARAPLTPEKKEEIRQMLQRTPGISNRTVSKTMGVCRKTVERLRKGLNLGPCVCGRPRHRGTCRPVENA